MRVLIVDDEPLARNAMIDAVSEREDVDGFDTASDAVEALEKLSADTYDVVLVDMSLSDSCGTSLLDRLRLSRRGLPSVILVAASNGQAAGVSASSLDCVVKPIPKERIDQALDVASGYRLSERPVQFADASVELQTLRSSPPRIAVKSGGSILFVDPRAVVVVQAERNYVRLVRESGSFLLREPLGVVELELRPYGFIRIHRSVLINRSFVEQIRPCPSGEYALCLMGGKEYTVTRTYRNNIRSLATSWVGHNPW